MQYLFENDLGNLNNNSIDSSSAWSINLSTIFNEHCSAFGNGQMPDWFTELLQMLNVDDRGYLSKNI